MFRVILFVSASVSIGYVLYRFFYWRQMHALVDLENGVLDAPASFRIAGGQDQGISVFVHNKNIG